MVLKLFTPSAGLARRLPCTVTTPVVYIPCDQCDVEAPGALERYWRSAERSSWARDGRLHPSASMRRIRKGSSESRGLLRTRSRHSVTWLHGLCHPPTLARAAQCLAASWFSASLQFPTTTRLSLIPSPPPWRPAHHSQRPQHPQRTI